MQKTLIYIDSNSRTQILSSGSPVTRVSDYPVIERGQWQVLCIQFINKTTDAYGFVDLTPTKLDSQASYIAVGDADFDDDNSLMFKSLQSTLPFAEDDPQSNRINIPGDWIDGGTANIDKGQLSVRINSDTIKFTQVISSNARLIDGLYIYIKQYTQNLSNPSTIALIPFVAVNTVRDWKSPEESVPEGAQLVTFVNEAFKNPIEFQFSDNSTDWHDTQSTEDRYYRQRIANIGVEWSTPVAFVNGGGEGGGGSTNASDIIISAESMYYAGMDVASALQQIGAELDGLEAELEVI